jgi:hypothetical protein
MIDAGSLLAEPVTRMTVRTRNRLIAFSILAAPFVFLICLLLFWNAEPLPPVPPLPNPNGYDDLVKAGQMITDKVGDFDKMNEEELRSLVTTNLKAIRLARTGLQQHCLVTLNYSPTSADILVKHSALLHLAQAFATEGRLAEMENRVNDAIESDLDLVRLSNESARGGVVIDQLVGTAIEAIGVEQLQRLVGQLDIKSCREATAMLETLDSQKQTWNQVMQHERDWSRRAFPGLRNELTRILSRRAIQKANQDSERAFMKHELTARQLIIDFAARAYELDKGHPPASVNDLVPDYLKAIPQDPLTGTNMVYLP